MILKPRQDVFASFLNNWENKVVEFKSGETSKTKRILLRGLTAAQVSSKIKA